MTMDTLTIEWTGRRWATDEQEARAIEAAKAVLEQGGTWVEAVKACDEIMPPTYNYIVTTIELMRASPLMDDDIREAIHDDPLAVDPIWFLAEYKRRHLKRFGVPFSDGGAA